ncbi:MAG: hypothetical protein WKF42_05255 [Solirubrobacteraceae bacterium]
MGTTHPRIGVTKDPDLAAALDATRPLLASGETRSEAGHVRRLALIGARALGDGTVEARAALDRQRVLDRRGVRAATRGLDALGWLDAEPIDASSRASRTLEWVRGER